MKRPISRVLVTSGVLVLILLGCTAGNRTGSGEMTAPEQGGADPANRSVSEPRESGDRIILRRLTNEEAGSSTQAENDWRLLPLSRESGLVGPESTVIGPVLDRFDDSADNRAIFDIVTTTMTQLQDGRVPTDLFREPPGRVILSRLEQGARWMPSADSWLTGMVGAAGSGKIAATVKINRQGYRSVIGTVILEHHGTNWYISDMLMEFHLLEEPVPEREFSRWEPSDAGEPRVWF